MTDLKPDANLAAAAPDNGDDPLSHLHKMSTTAGLGSTDYVAVNGIAVTTIFMGLASSLALLDITLLAIPVATVVLAIVALRQIANSNGTQTGRALAWGGMVLAMLFVASIGGRA